jgi:hypothetical protein
MCRKQRHGIVHGIVQRRDVQKTVARDNAVERYVQEQKAGIICPSVFVIVILEMVKFMKRN